jgi:hypothetical protein
LRTAIIGSTPAARRAGTTDATSVASASNIVAAASTAKSHGFTGYSRKAPSFMAGIHELSRQNR